MEAGEDEMSEGVLGDQEENKNINLESFVKTCPIFEREANVCRFSDVRDPRSLCAAAEL